MRVRGSGFGLGTEFVSLVYELRRVGRIETEEVRERTASNQQQNYFFRLQNFRVVNFASSLLRLH